MLEKEEIVSPNLEELKSHYHSIITLLGEDAGREGLLKTPTMLSKAMLSLTKGYHMDPHEVLRSAKFQEEYSQMVIVKDIDFFSLCEHHMLPFYGKAHVAYIPNGYITGLSKIARVVDIFSHRLQVQERMTLQIKDCIQETLNPLGVMVVVEAKHMCMQMRGVEKQKFYYYYFRLYRSFQSSQDSRRVYESDSARQGVIRFTKCGRCSSPSMRIASGTDEGVSRHR